MFSIEQILEAFSSSADIPQGAKDAMQAAVTELQSLRAAVNAAHHRAGEAEKAVEGYQAQLQERNADLMKLYQAAGVNMTLTHQEARQAKALEKIHILKRSNETRAEALVTLQERATGCRSDQGLFGGEGWIDRVIGTIENNAILRSEQAAACAKIAEILLGPGPYSSAALPDKVAEIARRTLDRDRVDLLTGRANRAEARVKDLESQVRYAEDRLKEVYAWLDQNAPRVPNADHISASFLTGKTITEQLNIVADARCAEAVGEALKHLTPYLWCIEIQLGLGDTHTAVTTRLERINQRLSDIKRAMGTLWDIPTSQET